MTQEHLFRSEEMALIQLIIPAEVAHTCVAELGKLAKVQFRDLNSNSSAFQRPFVAEIKRVNEMERLCRFLVSQIKKSNISINQPALYNDDASSNSRAYIKSAQEMDDLQETLQDHEVRIQQLNDAYHSLIKQHIHLTELQQALIASDSLFLKVPANRQNLLAATASRDVEEQQHSQYLEYVTGLIPKEKMHTFQRIVWRSTRGNILMNFTEGNYEAEEEESVCKKDVFAIFTHGQEMMTKVKRISESLGATLYTVDQHPRQRQEALVQVSDHIKDVQFVLAETKQARSNELIKISNNLSDWSTTVQREKGIYHTMNLFNFDINKKCLVAEGWCPKLDLDSIRLALQSAIEISPDGNSPPFVFSELPTIKKPPTYFRVNKWTEGFQSIMDAYGIARYGEVNPGLFTVVTFPFLFAVMFGDVGHGLLLFAFALSLVLHERKLAIVKDEIFSIFFSGRYMLLMMAIFSIYTGWIYNDFFGLPLHVFKSGYQWIMTDQTDNEMTMEGVPNGHVYPFGIDPAWHNAENALLFTNSYKMKQAIILGVLHMSFAICLNIFNHTHFKTKSFILLEFLPQLLFFQSIFGYLVFCILYKWSIHWFAVDNTDHLLYGPPPNLLNMLIYMFLTPGQVKPQDQLYRGQGTVQLVLVVIALVCIPWMWFAKPFYLNWKNGREGAIRLPDEEEETAPTSTRATIVEEAVITNRTEAVVHLDNEEDDDMEEEKKFDFGEEMIHQTIHTIEFCLNCISNTASYLRLWALSLAHTQLSSVLWDMTIKIWFGFTYPITVIGLVIGFALWFVLTVGILLCMEGLSAFLHALRLHWVEFNGKFYRGDGVPFEPFSFHRRA